MWIEDIFFQISSFFGCILFFWRGLNGGWVGCWLITMSLQTASTGLMFSLTNDTTRNCIESVTRQVFFSTAVRKLYQLSADFVYISQSKWTKTTTRTSKRNNKQHLQFYNTYNAGNNNNNNNNNKGRDGQSPAPSPRPFRGRTLLQGSTETLLQYTMRPSIIHPNQCIYDVKTGSEFLTYSKKTVLASDKRTSP